MIVSKLQTEARICGEQMITKYDTECKKCMTYDFLYECDDLFRVFCFLFVFVL